MSIPAMKAVFGAVATLSPSETLILLVLANYADQDGGSCWPSQQTIATKARTSRRGVQKLLRRLTERGLVSVVAPARQHQSTRYRLDLAALSRGEPGSPLKASPRGERRDAQRRTAGRPAANGEASRGERGSPDPSLTVLNRHDPSAHAPAAPVFAEDDETDYERIKRDRARAMRHERERGARR